jgi:hypothetical protein
VTGFSLEQYLQIRATTTQMSGPQALPGYRNEQKKAKLLREREKTDIGEHKITANSSQISDLQKRIY